MTLRRFFSSNYLQSDQILRKRCHSLTDTKKSSSDRKKSSSDKKKSSSQEKLVSYDEFVWDGFYMQSQSLPSSPTLSLTCMYNEVKQTVRTFVSWCSHWTSYNKVALKLCCFDAKFYALDERVRDLWSVKHTLLTWESFSATMPCICHCVIQWVWI